MATNKKTAGAWAAGLIVSSVAGLVCLIGLACADPEAAGKFVSATRPRPYKKVVKEGFWGDTTVEYWW